MNKIKLFIATTDSSRNQLPPINNNNNNNDKKLSNKIKKFNSERNLFFAGIYGSNHAGATPAPLPAEKPAGKMEWTRTFCKSGLLKKCKSLKELYQQQQQQQQPSAKRSTPPAIEKATFKNLDDFERNYLLSSGKRELVQELRKNFENQQRTAAAAACKPPPQQQPPTMSAETVANLCKRRSATDAPSDSTTRKCITRHSFNTSTPLAATMIGADDSADLIMDYEHIDAFVERKRGGWSQSALDLSTITSPAPVPIVLENVKVLDTIGDDDDRNDDVDDYKNADDFIKRPALKANKLTNVRSMDGNNDDTMSLCELNLYPIYMQNICSGKFSNSTKNNNNNNSSSGYGSSVTSSSDLNEGVGMLKKYGSVNHIDLNMLKNELNDFVVDQQPHRTTTTGFFSRNCGIQRSMPMVAIRRKELDLEQKIDLEIKMREGSAKLLAACNNAKNAAPKSMGFGGGSSSSSSSSASSPHNTQMLEAAKNLLTSNERMTAYMAELQRRKKDRSCGDSNNMAKRQSPSLMRPTGRVSLSEIRMPLMWRDTDHFKNKGDHRRFAVFCLAKIDTEIYDTSLLCPVDRNSTDISFNDAILFTNVPPDFELKLEVYAVMMEADLSIASTPRKIKNTIHSSISRTVGRRLAANLKDELNNTKIGPKFELIATASLSLDEASDLPHTYDLTILPPTPAANHSSGAFNSLPLFGHYCCRLAVQPDSIETSSCCGELSVQARGASTRTLEGYARLQAFRIDVWDDEATCQQTIVAPRRSVEVTRDTKVKHRGELDLVLSIMEEGTIEEYTLRAKSLSEATKWYAAIKKCIKEHAAWRHVTNGNATMQLAVAANIKNSFVRSSARHRSLYDQVPILENRQSSRPSSRDVFAVPDSVDTSPTLNDFRLRANSSGRSSSHSSSIISAGSLGSISSSRKSHWPFGSK